jgi:adenine phosphoribosyltransferase
VTVGCFLENSLSIHRSIELLQMALTDDQRLQEIKDSIRLVCDFPKEGIKFRDVSSLTQNPRLFKLTVDILAERYRDQGVAYVAGCDARGFIWGGALAAAIGAGFLMIRKPGKLPPQDRITEQYGKEYGRDAFELFTGGWDDKGINGGKVVIIDDLLATGGSALAAATLIERAHGHVHEIACIIGLPLLNGRDRLAPRPVYTMVEFIE